jgi:isopentenyl-diphosphate delta-isomerase
MNSVKNQGQKIVSSADELLILVDDDDSDVGFLSKTACHDGGGVLHRAFSVFLFNDAGELLLQQRGAEKRLWPGFWSNSCCSHPRKGETLGYATSRRLQEELNIGADLEFVYKFIYQAGYGDVGSEHELCSVYLGRLRDVARANGTEIEALRYVSAGELHSEFVTSPEHFTPWFKLEWQHLNDHHVELLSRYTCPA